MQMLLATPTTEQLLGIALLVLVLGVVWIILRFALRMAMRVFALGCTAILLIGLLLALAFYLR
jgi:hypothetical protein